MKPITSLLFCLVLFTTPATSLPADRLLGVHSARVMSQSMPWIAEEAGLFRRYELEFPLVYIGSSPLATAAMLGGDGELLMDGGLGPVRAFVQGTTELVCIGGQKNILTQSILAKPPIKRLEDLRGKKVGVTRIGATTHYFATQAFRKIGMEAGRDYTMIQTGGAPEMLAALVSGAIDAGTLSSPLGRSGRRPRSSVHRLRTGSSHSSGCRGIYDATLDARQATSGTRAIHARDGGSCKDSAHRQRIYLQSLGQTAED